MAARSPRPNAISDPPLIGRQARRRIETRTKLLDATRALVLERAVPDISINEIAERADVGFGSFYNYFTSKENALEAMIEREGRSFNAAIDSVLLTKDDAGARVVAGTRYVVRHGLRDPMWRWLLMSSYGVVAVRVLGESLRRDLELGKSTGRFEIDDVPMMTEFIIGAVLNVVAAAAAGRLPERKVDQIPAMVLRVLGVEQAAVSLLLKERLPPLPAVSPAASSPADLDVPARAPSTRRT